MFFIIVIFVLLDKSITTFPMKINFFISFLILCSFPILAQNSSIDSLSRLLENAKDPKEKVSLLCKVSQAQTEIGNFTKGGEIASKALAKAKEIGDKKGEGLAYYSLARLNQYMRDWDNALIYHYQAIQLFDEVNATEELAWSYLNMGISFDAKKEFNRAIRYDNKALESFKKIRHKQGEAYSYLNLGSALFGKGNVDGALTNLEKAKVICEQIKDQTGVGYVYNIRGDIYFKIGKLDESIFENNACLAIRNKENNKRDIAFLNGQNASIYFKQNKLKEAEAALLVAEKAGVDVQVHFALKDIYLTWSKVDSARGNHKAAYEHFKQYNASEKIIHEEDRKMEVTALKYAFGNEQKAAKEAADTALAECDKKLTESGNSPTVNKTIFLMIGSIGAVIIALFLFRNIRNRKQ